ncbi:peptidylprolyl isomerase [Sphingomonas changnyeongensis]|uniref:peptidylprolyl isomerase n=2 Tax=Sphingomonas changnyeongensis TaxID=2698679 RepID=A0A7Z2NXY2_9SPHN|nr:peptidylprolyl isomerase [Sphingomonas changnyeongensis]QHL91851.1 peptidylprolyl isomerase [Sphingomonas changnyeongensis]
MAAVPAAALRAQPAPPPATSPAPAPVRVTLQTALGPIVIEVDRARAPVTSANFLRYVDQKRLDGASFYRAAASPGSTEYGLVQFGLNPLPQRLLPPIAHEPTTRTGLTHLSGTISLARGAPGTGQGDFFIVVGDMPSLDADPKAAGDNQGYAAFGRVVEGMDVVRAVLAAPISPTLGSGSFRGQMLAAPVRITSARRVP